MRPGWDGSGYPDAKFAATIGFADCTAAGADPDVAIRAADRAMYAAKVRGKSRIEVVKAG